MRVKVERPPGRSKNTGEDPLPESPWRGCENPVAAYFWIDMGGSAVDNCPRGGRKRVLTGGSVGE